MQPGSRFASVVGKLRQDLVAGGVVALVALPLCLGIALASNAPLASGLVAGIVGGVVVGLVSGSHTSVSGPAAGLTAVVDLRKRNSPAATRTRFAPCMSTHQAFAPLPTSRDMLSISSAEGRFASERSRTTTYLGKTLPRS